MALKWKSLSQDSATAQQPSVPFGAPEGHFPDQLNNIQREGLAAIAEIGSAVFGGNDANGANTAAPAVSDTLKQLMYDFMWPVNSMRMWYSNSGANSISALTPSGVTATWQICDGTNSTPDLRNKVLGGANPGGGGGATYTGTTAGSSNTGASGSHTATGTVASHILTIAELPAHNHGVTDPGHTHTYVDEGTEGNVSGGQEQTTGRENSDTDNEVTGSNTTGVTIQNTGSGSGHVHTLTMNAVSTHTHTVDPVRTLVEIYQRLT